MSDPQTSAAGGKRPAPTAERRGLGQAFIALASPDYRIFWICALVSNIGTWVQDVTKQDLIYRLTGSTVWLGLDSFVTWLPIVVLLPVGGYLADHQDRRRILILTNMALAISAVALAALVWFDMLRVWHIVVVSGVMGVTQGLIMPSVQSLLPELVGQERLANAVALNAVQFNISRAIGPAIGGVLLATAGAAWCFGFNAVSFLAVIFAFTVIRWRDMPRTPSQGSMLHGIRQGVEYLRTRPDLIAIHVLAFINALGIVPIMKMLAAYIGENYSETAHGSSGLSTLLACFGVGAILGAGSNAARGTRAPTPMAAIGFLALSGVCQVAMALPLPFLVVAALTVVSGFAFIGAGNRMLSAIVSSSPPWVRGRLSSFYLMLFSIGFMLASIAWGFLAKWIGTGNVFAVAGAVILVSVVLVARSLRKRGIRFRPDAHLDVEMEAK